MSDVGKQSNLFHSLRADSCQAANAIIQYRKTPTGHWLVLSGKMADLLTCYGLCFCGTTTAVQYLSWPVSVVRGLAMAFVYEKQGLDIMAFVSVSVIQGHVMVFVSAV